MSPLFLLQSSPFPFPSLPFSPQTLTLPFKPLSLAHRHRPFTSLRATDPDLLHALTASSSSSPNLTGGLDSNTSDRLPVVRTYESDLASLTLVGSVGLEQALTAAAADGGDAAEEHLANGMETMVVETLFPGSAGDRTTVSTRLVLPAKKVKEKAKKLRSSLALDILSSSSISKNILAMTFRQVVLQILWSFQLSLFCPGTKRDMEDLANPKEVLADFTVSSSNQRFLSKLAEIVCVCALENTKKFYLQSVGGLSSNSILGWFQKPRSAYPIDSSICVYRISQAEILKNARNQLKKFNLVKGKYVNRERKSKRSWWDPANNLELDRFGGLGFSEWAIEFVPAYKLQLDANKYKDAKLEGWKELSNNRWEVLLTHFQMEELASILDMYYEDQYTLPNKELSCGLVTESAVITKKKNSLWKLILVSLASGCILVSVGILAQICFPNLMKVKKVSGYDQMILPSAETYTSNIRSLEADELEALCKSIVQKIKDELNWPGDVLFNKDLGAWTGILPTYLGEPDMIMNSLSSNEESLTNFTNGFTVDSQSHSDLTASVTAASQTDNSAIPTIAQDIASYQVVVSGDGKIVGFQPTSRVAVNHWASNPIAKVLYNGKILSPGLFEPSLKIPCPSEVVLIGLLMSVNAESKFALARPMS